MDIPLQPIPELESKRRDLVWIRNQFARDVVQDMLAIGDDPSDREFTGSVQGDQLTISAIGDYGYCHSTEFEAGPIEVQVVERIVAGFAEAVLRRYQISYEPDEEIGEGAKRANLTVVQGTTQ